MHKKIVIGIVVVVAVAALSGAGYGAYHKLSQSTVADSQVNGPVFEGALVNIASTTLTVKAQNGEEKSFTFSRTTPVITEVGEGEVGRSYMQFSAGDVLSVTAMANDPVVAKSIEIVPLASSTPADATAFMLKGTVVARTATSATILLATNDPALALTPIKITFTVTSTTQFLSQVQGGQIGKPKSDITTGQLVAVSGYEKGQIKTATKVLLLRIY